MNLKELLNNARRGEAVDCFAKVDGSDICHWPGPGGDPQTWDEFFERQYPYIVPQEVGGQKYFGLTPDGQAISGKEIISLHDFGITLLTAEQYRNETNQKPQ